ncbi:hypothetical protein NEMIN01_0332 [Nematocida minor]|uniref:uncharacterized protein n=1 Tax=Nematocida minor TaxID=1912983 RepID=UPI00221FC181|nr:uncharacterized protein NEMIN01_0332 [Nematocida minor]KAI5189166.1 hypothetical protein NEMIN01_0332 [Nematocida minor]
MSLQYLLTLLPWHYENGLSGLFVERVENVLRNSEEALHSSESAMLCFKCRRIMVPAVNSTVRLHNTVVAVCCAHCKSSTSFKVPPVYKNAYIKDSYTIDSFLSSAY